MEQFIITKEWLNNHKTKNGGWTKYQAELIYLNWPLVKGWQKYVIGKGIDIDMKAEFEVANKPNKKQVREVLTIDNCIAYLFKNGVDIDYSNFIRIKKLYTELSKSNQLQAPEFYNLNP